MNHALYGNSRILVPISFALIVSGYIAAADLYIGIRFNWTTSIGYGLGTGCVARIFWRTMVEKNPSAENGMWAGAVIGVTMHPVGCLFWMILDAFFGTRDHPEFGPVETMAFGLLLGVVGGLMYYGVFTVPIMSFVGYALGKATKLETPPQISSVEGN